MEEHHEHITETNGLSVDVTSKKYIPGKKNKKSIGDTNCNLTVLKSRGEEVLADGNVIESCENKLSGLNLNGPSKISNGIESEHFSESHCCSVSESNVGEIASQSVGCRELSDVEKESVDSSGSSLDKKVDNGPSSLVNLSTGDLSSSGSDIQGRQSTILPDANSHSTNNPEQVSNESSLPEISYVSYESELQMPEIMRLIQKDLSEPYSIYTYRYFIHNWPQLCFLAMDGSSCVGAIVCKLDMHRKVVKRGYIAMLAVDEKYRKRKIGSNLVLKAIRAMVTDGADEVVLETEITNKPALRLYENLGFVRDKRLFRYYLNGVDALRLKLWLR